MRNNQLRQWFIFCSVVIGLLTIPVASFAADAVKFGAIDVQKILNESEAGKKAKSDLESLIKSKQSSDRRKRQGDRETESGHRKTGLRPFR